MRNTMTLISIRIHPRILKVADQFAALQPERTRFASIANDDVPNTRSDVLRQALALGLPLLINPPPKTPKDKKPCRSSQASRRKTPNGRPAA